MSYLVEFRELVESDAKARFVHLWEEYCLSDEVDEQELIAILELIKDSPLAMLFGEYAETALPLWKKVSNESPQRYILRLLLDLESTNSSLFADLATEFLKRYYGEHRHFNEFLRLVGLRYRDSFQGAISRFELLAHMEKGNFVFHSGGWGVGEILEVSLLRQHSMIEFEAARAPKEVSFDNAFKTLQPISKEHFLARRFGNPDALEKEGKEEPLALIQLLLRDLGPKTAAEIKDELCELVIPEKDWAKWWQLARAKIKKDTRIKAAEGAKAKFQLLNEELSHESRFIETMKSAKGAADTIHIIYQFSRDFPEIFKSPLSKQTSKEALIPIVEQSGNSNLECALKLQALFLLEEIASEEYKGKAQTYLLALTAYEEILKSIEIVAFKKEMLTVLREKNRQWEQLFLHLLFSASPNQIRDYVLKELFAQEKLRPLVVERLRELLHRVTLYPEAFFWYFQKICNQENFPLSDKENKSLFLEAFFILLHYLEDKNEYREQVKKMQNLLAEKRYAIFRSIIENTSVEYLSEVLLLASKCHTLTRQELRTLLSLAQVVQPSLGDKEEEKRDETIWTTAQGYKKIQERIERIGTVEMIDNAREIEAARALGDLRENSEYKAAQERRANLQRDLKTLSRQLNQARILTKDDIIDSEVCVGSIVDLTTSKGKKICYTLLGPWDADTNKSILSYQSKLAQAMMGKKNGDRFEFQNERYTINSIKSFL